jgi:TonB-linked SusC/RagA family outer membrane protein
MDYGNGFIDRGGFPGYSRPFLSDANALQQVLLNTDYEEGNTSSGNVAADFNLTKNLTFIVNATYNLHEGRYTEVLNPYYGQFRSTGGTVYKQHYRQFSNNLQQLLRYTPSFGENHLTLTFGHEYTDVMYYSLSASKSKMFSQANKELNGAIQDGQSSASYTTEYNNEGYFFNGQYDYMNKMFASASFRRDASSRFAPEYQWGNFWSVGGAWILTKEPWFKSRGLNELKLKASYGSQGNDSIGNFRYIDTFDITNSSGSLGTTFRAKGTSDITWETNTNFNAGVEFNFMDRLTGSLEYFKRNTTDMLFSFSVAPSLGYSSYYDNVGDLYNKGWELTLNLNLVNKKDFQWDVNFNITTLKNCITKLHQDKKTSDIWDLQGNMYQGYSSSGAFISEGLPLYTWREKEFAGIDPETGKSLWYKNLYEQEYKDGKLVDKETEDEFGNKHKTWIGKQTTDTYSEADYYVTNKTAIPDYYGGLGTTIYFKGLDFSINTSYQSGGYQYDATYATFMGNPTASRTGDNIHVDALKAWTKENPSTEIPRWVFGDTYSNGASTRFLTKSTYFNIENISAGYTIPAKLSSKLGIQSLRIYVIAQNVKYWSVRKGFDPRQGSGNTDTNATYYSPMRTVSGGVTLKF